MDVDRASVAPAATVAHALVVASLTLIHGQARKVVVLTPTGAFRVLEAVRVFELLGEPWIVSSGGPASGRDMIPESEAMQRTLIELGVPADKILLESESRVTRDEAIFTARMLRRLGITSCIVVTTDVHMPRALLTFRHEGLQAVPAIASAPVSSQDPRKSWLPTPDGIEFSQAVLHEYAGLAWYKLRGWM